MLYKEKNYIINLNYLFNNYIREYDISKANINVLYSKGAIDKNIYMRLYNADRMYRQIYIGKLIQKNPRLQEILNEGIIEYKQKLFEANNINDNDIVSIKNDAVFILNKIPTKLSFDNVTFKFKNIYTSFMKLNELEVYYGDWLGKQVIDIKGIKDIDIEVFHMAFLNIIITYLDLIQRGGPHSALQYITNVINMYVNLELPISYYRRFRSSNDYILNSITCSYAIYNLQDTVENKKALNIDYNFNILRIMHTYTSQLLYDEKER